MRHTARRTTYPVTTAPPDTLPIEPQWRTPSGALLTPAAHPPPRRRTRFAAFFALTVMALAGLTGAAVADLMPTGPAFTDTRRGIVGVPIGVENHSLAAVAAAVTPSIATVRVAGGAPAIGSGVVLTTDGLVLTNDHVVNSGGSVRLRLWNGQTAPGRVVATDPVHDLALVQGASLTDLTPAVFGTDDSVAVGDTVLAFGSPFGLEGTVTAGIVSAVDRRVDTEASESSRLLQTDAPINAGNSGGALVDTSGRVVGINVAIATSGEDTGNLGVGFAVPADTVTEAVRVMRARVG